MAGRARAGAGAAAIAAVLLAAGWGWGCSCGKRPSPEDEKRAQAREAVTRFFAALPERDCDVLGPMLVQPQGGADCAKVVGSLHGHGYRLVEVLGAEVDGRDPLAVIVRVRLEENGRQREAPLRMERHPEGWKLRL